MPLQFPTRAERHGRQPHAASLTERGIWPEFLYHDPILDRLLGAVMSGYPEFQFYAWDDEREEVVGVGMAVPASWSGRPKDLLDGGLDAVVEARFADGAAEPNVLCALQILIAAEFRAQGLSSRMIRRMAEPLTTMQSYIGWRRPDGTHFDPWLRTHERLGAEMVKVAPRSSTIPGSVAEWEQWAQMTFPETGSYVVSGALVPVDIDRERDEGLYVEPNVWMVHPAG